MGPDKAMEKPSAVNAVLPEGRTAEIKRKRPDKMASKKKKKHQQSKAIDDGNRSRGSKETLHHRDEGQNK